jgi:protein-S-isoprenylcysteine O-methyltransferase Ste14
MPPQPPLTPSAVVAAQIVTLTVFSSGSPTQSGLPALSGGGGSSVPIPAIVGGVVGGVALAVLLVIVWKHWGRVIKRTERQRRKEVVRSAFCSPSSFFSRTSSIVLCHAVVRIG